ncbi:hypothetical protein L2E82_02088 [Cichorium intybus]|uniref:Uncharacterized protein n=1 Tax=Cichorium intybus TaxID=13427 RepID=A0ACB9H1S2_CICIN|nr:hypothetical protein L2E82_02088 [Cichorium intybus]
MRCDCEYRTIMPISIVNKGKDKGINLINTISHPPSIHSFLVTVSLRFQPPSPSQQRGSRGEERESRLNSNVRLPRDGERTSGSAARRQSPRCRCQCAGFCILFIIGFFCFAFDIRECFG